jgi:diacylglycerol kinase family enzyme
VSSTQSRSPADPPPNDQGRPIPAFINPKAGNADAATEALSRSARFDVRRVAPSQLSEEIRHAIADGATRILVAGGDGSINTAATVVAGTSVELAVLPAGTLNHFSKDLALPLDLHQAAKVASEGRLTHVDTGYVNDRLFLNTTSAGAYVTFVRLRERLERRLGYTLASIIAGLRIFFTFRTFRVSIEVDGVGRQYVTPLVFIGVGERELKLPALGARVAGGAHGLHVMVLRSRTAARAVALGLEAVARGVNAVSHTPALDSFIVDRCVIEPHHRRQRGISLDGEIVSVDTPLDVRLARGALRVVVPEPRSG